MDSEFFDLRHASRNFPSGKVRLFGKYLLHEGHSTSSVYSRANFKFYREVFSFGFDGKKLGAMCTPWSYDIDIGPEDILSVEETNFVNAEAKLVNPYINSKTHDLFYSLGGHLFSIYMEDGNIMGFEPEEQGCAFTEFYMFLLDQKEALQSEQGFVKLRRHMRRLEKKVRGAKTPALWEKHHIKLSNTRKNVLMRLTGTQFRD